MFRVLLSAGSDFVRVLLEDDASTGASVYGAPRLVVMVDRSKISTHGRPALRSLLLKLHIYRSTADVGACRPFYTALTEVKDGPEAPFLQWREAVLAATSRLPRQVFVQSNTFQHGNQVELREYDATPRGLIRSWAEREL